MDTNSIVTIIATAVSFIGICYAVCKDKLLCCFSQNKTDSPPSSPTKEEVMERIEHDIEKLVELEHKKCH